MSRSIWSITLVISVLTGQICFGAKSLSYVIQRGDTLSEIAQRFGVSQRQLIELNDLENNTIRQGQRLEIPSTSKVYIVRSGDTLSHLAIRFNTTVNKLSEINKLKNRRIKIGQKLRIPFGDTKIRGQNKKAEKYIVRKGRKRKN